MGAFQIVARANASERRSRLFLPSAAKKRINIFKDKYVNSENFEIMYTCGASSKARCNCRDAACHVCTTPRLLH